jgi:hypothetical protein
MNRYIQYPFVVIFGRYIRYIYSIEEITDSFWNKLTSVNQILCSTWYLYEFQKRCLRYALFWKKTRNNKESRLKIFRFSYNNDDCWLYHRCLNSEKDKRLVDNLLSDLTYLFGVVYCFYNIVYIGLEIDETKKFFMNRQNMSNNWI